MADLQGTLEIEALGDVSEALDRLGGDKEAKLRVIRWVVSKHELDELSVLRTKKDDSNTRSGDEFSGSQGIADLYAAAGPNTDAERALVAAFWLQQRGGGEDMPSNLINKELKNLGHGVGNITDALDSLIQRKPQLIIQTRKDGTSRQARKKYKLTRAGADFVTAMIRKSQPSA